MIIFEEINLQISNLKICFDRSKPQDFVLNKSLWQDNRVLVAEYLPEIYPLYSEWGTSLAEFAESPNMGTILPIMKTGSHVQQALKQNQPPNL